MEENNEPKRNDINEVLNKYKTVNTTENNAGIFSPSVPNFNKEEYEKIMSKETDPDLIIGYDIVKLPSRGLYYKNHVSELIVEYMTSKDEDLLTTQSLIENGTVLDILLRRKIKTNTINVDELLPGDRDAIILFLRTSSYGVDYTVQVNDPRTGKPFKQVVDLTKLTYKSTDIRCDDNGNFDVFIKMRKKNVKFRLISSSDELKILKKAEAIQEAYGTEFSDFQTLKLKSHIVSIEGNTDRSYIDRFVDAMPALDALTIRKKIIEVSPGVDMNYEFKAPDGFKFKGILSVDIDFFFPNI